jgi:hypothetical protein
MTGSGGTRFAPPATRVFPSEREMNGKNSPMALRSATQLIELILFSRECCQNRTGNPTPRNGTLVRRNRKNREIIKDSKCGAHRCQDQENR